MPSAVRWDLIIWPGFNGHLTVIIYLGCYVVNVLSLLYSDYCNQRAAQMPFCISVYSVAVRAAVLLAILRILETHA